MWKRWFDDLRRLASERLSRALRQHERRNESHAEQPPERRRPRVLDVCELESLVVFSAAPFAAEILVNSIDISPQQSPDVANLPLADGMGDLNAIEDGNQAGAAGSVDVPRSQFATVDAQFAELLTLVAAVDADPATGTDHAAEADLPAETRVGTLMQ